MKECPICKAKAFDDAVICYGCLHSFNGAEVALGACEEGSGSDRSGSDCCEMVVPQVVPPEEVRPRGAHCKESASWSPPEFNIKMCPVMGTAGSITWSCAVEVA